MSFLAAMFLLNLDTFDAFVAFANLLNRPCQMAFFMVDQPMVWIAFSFLLQSFHYPSLGEIILCRWHDPLFLRKKWRKKTKNKKQNSRYICKGYHYKNWVLILILKIHLIYTFLCINFNVKLTWIMINGIECKSGVINRNS